LSAGNPSWRHKRNPTKIELKSTSHLCPRNGVALSSVTIVLLTCLTVAAVER
jgi:hypothetical protein